MARRIDFGQTLRTGTTLRIDPKVILSSQVLELSQVELEQFVESEINENPALERIDDGPSAPSQDEILKIVAPGELSPSGECHELWRSLPKDTASEVDWVELTAMTDSLADHLRAQLSAKLPSSPALLVEYLVGSVNERGYVTSEPEEVALACHVSLEEAQEAFEALKTCEPLGVGAADLKECLNLQLRFAQSDAEKLARLIVRNDWDELVAKDLRSIRKRYRVPAELVESAMEVIIGLNPFPGEGYAPATVQSREPVSTAYPDLVLHRDESGWTIDVTGPGQGSLRLARGYERRRQELEAMSRPPKDEKRHVGEFLERANRFIEALSQRGLLMRRIGQYLIERQHGFVSTGEYRFLVPLTRCQMAQDLGTHESTVSRATNRKFVQLANGEVVPFEVFFKPALRVQKLIEEILATENPDSPLSDESIARILDAQGIKVARRTVNKYRDRNRTLSSRRRKSA